MVHFVLALFLASFVVRPLAEAGTANGPLSGICSSLSLLSHPLRGWCFPTCFRGSQGLVPARRTWNQTPSPSVAASPVWSELSAGEPLAGGHPHRALSLPFWSLGQDLPHSLFCHALWRDVRGVCYNFVSIS